MGEDGLLRKSMRIWILYMDERLKLKILITSHCGTIVRSAIQATENWSLEDFVWDRMKKDVSRFIRGCLQCIVTRTGELVPRPLGHSLHGDSTNYVFHMEFLFMGAGNEVTK